jgi:hypothetical protein
MSDLKIAVGGLDYFAEQKTTQVPVALAAGTYTSTNGIMTITSSTHGLTFSPASGTLPNYFVQFGGSGYSAITGTGVLLGNVFRIIAIPSATTFQIYTTITSITVTTSSTLIPVFMPVFQTALLSSVANLPSSTIPYYGTAQAVNSTFGANCVASYNPDNTFVPLDATTGNTPTTPPTFRTMLAASAGGQLRYGPQDIIAASGGAGTSYLSIVQ